METAPGDDESFFAEFEKTIGQPWDDLIAEVTIPQIRMGLPPEVINALNAPGELSWPLVREAVRSQKQRSVQLGQEVINLMHHEGSFNWPVEDPLRCLAIGLLRILTTKVIGRAFEEFNRSDGEETQEDVADWWKNAS
jgi:hypothetical protein